MMTKIYAEQITTNMNGSTLEIFLDNQIVAEISDGKTDLEFVYDVLFGMGYEVEERVILLDNVDVQGHNALFTDSRIDRQIIPEGLYCYELRHGDDDSYPATIENHVVVNFFGTVLMAEEMKIPEDGCISLDYYDFGFTGERTSAWEYLANNGKEPKLITTEQELIQICAEQQKPFVLSQHEGELLLRYLREDESVVGHIDGRLFRGNHNEDGSLYWHEDSIDEQIEYVFELHGELLEDAKQQVKNAKDKAEFVESNKYMWRLEAEGQVLDSLFDRSKPGQELVALAERLALELVESTKSKGVEKAIEEMKKYVKKSEQTHTPPESNQRRGRMRL